MVDFPEVKAVPKTAGTKKTSKFQTICKVFFWLGIFEANNKLPKGKKDVEERFKKSWDKVQPSVLNRNPIGYVNQYYQALLTNLGVNLEEQPEESWIDKKIRGPITGLPVKQ